MSKAKKKSTDYFEYFRISAEKAKDAAIFMDKSFRSFDKDSFSDRVDEMHEIEHAADANRHEMIERLAREFLPPIEREDIVALAQELDNVVDAIDDVAQRVHMFNISEIRPEALEFSELIISCCNALLEAVAEFRNFRNSKTIKTLMITVNTLESDGDALHSRSVHSLFSENADPLSTVAWMKIFDGFEDCLDACEDAVDIIESVIMKNS